MTHLDKTLKYIREKVESNNKIITGKNDHNDTRIYAELQNKRLVDWANNFNKGLTWIGKY